MLETGSSLYCETRSAAGTWHAMHLHSKCPNADAFEWALDALVLRCPSMRGCVRKAPPLHRTHRFVAEVLDAAVQEARLPLRRGHVPRHVEVEVGEYADVAPGRVLVLVRSCGGSSKNQQLGNRKPPLSAPPRPGSVLFFHARAGPPGLPGLAARRRRW